MIDTRAKRASCLGLMLPFACVLPLADGAIGAADRLHLAHLYSGIAVGTAPAAGWTLVPGPSTEWEIATVNRPYVLHGYVVPNYFTDVEWIENAAPAGTWVLT